MTNLRWIESEIDRLIFSIERLKILNKNGDVAIQEKRLTHLNQIKNILEAWEVVKPKIKFEDLGEMQNGNMYRGYFDDCFDEEEYNKTEKALEKKDE